MENKIFIEYDILDQNFQRPGGFNRLVKFLVGSKTSRAGGTGEAAWT